MVRIKYVLAKYIPIRIHRKQKTNLKQIRNTVQQILLNDGLMYKQNRQK